MTGNPSVPPGDLKQTGSGDLRIVTSHELFAGKRELVIRHGERRYRLQITKAGKLILNK